jgi:tetratricopeptide (TPR) repeat protein
MKITLLYSFAALFLFSCSSKTEPIEVYKETFRDNFKNGKRDIDSLKELSIKEGLAGNFSRFKELCELVSQLDSNDADNLSRLAGVYLIDKKYNEGLTAINRSIKLDTGLKYNHNFTYKACLFYELKNTDSANFYFNKMLVLGKHDASNLNSVVDGFITFKNYDKAKEYNELLLKYYPKDEEANIKVAMELFNQNKNDEALSIMTKLCQNTNNPKVFATRSIFYHNMEKYNLALKDANKAVSLSNSVPWILTGRGRTKEKLKDYDGAEKDYKEAISKGDTTALRFYNTMLEELKRK